VVVPLVPPSGEQVSPLEYHSWRCPTS
jgi:hypothetical protein